MAFYDLEEQEQISALEAWWRQWGALLLLAIALTLGSVAAFQGWNWYKGSQAGEASGLYAEMLQASREGAPDKAAAAAAALADRYASTGYAPLGQLLNARLRYESGDATGAKQSLQWVIEHARDEQMKSVARYRLAGVLLDEKQYEQALKLLEGSADDQMANLYADLRGDIQLAQGQPAEARAAYQTALEKTEPRSPLRNLIQIKIDALGQPQ
jgi:predicted negative regulator of RcsB-dependent stress response